MPMMRSWLSLYLIFRLVPSNADHHVRRIGSNGDSDKNDRIPFGKPSLKSTGRSEMNRNLQTAIETRDCNEEFSSVTSEEIQRIFDFLMRSIDPINSTSTKDAVNLSVKYDVKVSKVCLKCSQIGFQDLDTEALVNTSPYGFQSYCSEDKYGWQATHSALLFSPIDGNTDSVLPGKLRGFLVGHDTTIDVNSGPTDLWPKDISSILNEKTLDYSEKVLLFQSFVSSLVASTAGAVAVMPDYIGYGESKDYDRAYLSPMVYEQAAAVSYAAAKRYISFVSDGCTELTDVASITGYGEGGYFALRGAMALEQNGVTILSSRPGGTPLDLDSQLGFSFELEETKPLAPGSLDLFLAFFGYAYSNSFPFVSNSNENEEALNSSWMNETNPEMNVLGWFNSPEQLAKEQILALLPADTDHIFNEALVSIYHESSYEGYPKNACRSGIVKPDSISNLCDAILDASLWDLLSTEIEFHVSICHSPQDDIIGFENIPNPTTLPPNVKFYSSKLDIMNPRGSHDGSMFLCALDPITDITSHSDSEVESNSPVFRQAIANSPSQCKTTATENPTTSSPQPQQCSNLYEGCGGFQECCNNLACKIRPTKNGNKLAKICSPPNRNNNRQSIAEEGVGGSSRRKERPGHA